MSYPRVWDLGFGISCLGSEDIGGRILLGKTLFSLALLLGYEYTPNLLSLPNPPKRTAPSPTLRQVSQPVEKAQFKLSCRPHTLKYILKHGGYSSRSSAPALSS